MVGVAERCEIQAGSGDEAVGKAARDGIGLSRDCTSAVSRLRLRWAAAASRCGALGGEAGARAWTSDAGGAAGIGHGGEGRARGPGDTTWSCGCCGSLDVDTLATALTVLRTETGEGKLIAVTSHLHAVGAAGGNVIPAGRRPA